MENNIAYYKISGNKYKTALKTTDGIIPKRLGVALVGGGGASGEAKIEN